MTSDSEIDCNGLYSALGIPMPVMDGDDLIEVQTAILATGLSAFALQPAALDSWCRENGATDFILYPQIGRGGFYILGKFRNENDAMLFKLRWS